MSQQPPPMCEHLQAVLAAQRRMRQAMAAESAMRALATMPASTGPVRPPTEAEREALRRTAQRLLDGSTATHQWGRLGEKERQLIVVYAGLRDSNPGERVSSIADRGWTEFTQPERTAIAQAVRLLLRRLGRMNGLASGR